MKRIAAVLAIGLLAAACSGSPLVSPTSNAPSSPAVTIAPSTSMATQPPTSSPTTKATRKPASTQPPATPAQVSARVTFDGTTCTYQGPTAIPFPAALTVDFEPTTDQQGSWVGVMAIKSGTTQTQLNDPSNPPAGVVTPGFVYQESYLFHQGAGTMAYRGATGLNPMAMTWTPQTGKPYDTYLVLCLPEMPGRPAGGFTILHVVQ